jgi:prevent-host-death family protein
MEGELWLSCCREELSVMEVGIRALRDGLSRYLAEVRGGHAITVTDHGRVIARILPAGEPTALERLIAEGRVRPGKRRKRSAPQPVDAAGMVSDLVAEQRR